MVKIRQRTLVWAYTKNSETSHEIKVANQIIFQQMKRECAIHNNAPDIIMLYNRKGTCMIKYIAMSGDRWVIKAEAEKP